MLLVQEGKQSWGRDLAERVRATCLYAYLTSILTSVRIVPQCSCKQSLQARHNLVGRQACIQVLLVSHTQKASPWSSTTLATKQ